MNEHERAFLFDLNGTMIDDMRYHLTVWYDALNELGAGLSHDEVKHQMYGKNQDMLDRVFGKDKFNEAEVERISRAKDTRYQELYKPHLTLLPGLNQFLKQAQQKDIVMGIGSAAPPFNIDFVLDNLDLRHYFKAVISGDDVTLSKPHPETFLLAARRAEVLPENCIVFEDVPKGAEAAMNAGMKCVVITSTHQAEEFVHYPNILFFANDYNDPKIRALVA
jgi:beta-phosphoglucomutase